MSEVSTNPNEHPKTFQEAIQNIDRSAPLTVDILAQLLQVQTNNLVGEFHKQLSKRDEIIEAQSKEIQSLKTENLQLRDSLDDLQQYSRRNSIRIDGFPTEPGDVKETIGNLETKVKTMFKDVMKVKLESTDFCRMHRVGKPAQSGKVKQVIVKFTNYGAKLRVMKARKTLREQAEARDTGGKTRVYINDDLTKRRAWIARQAREARKNKQIKDTWVYDGRIYVQPNSGDIKVITTEKGLENMLL